MEGCGGGASGRKHEGAQGIKFGIQPVDFGFEPGHLCCDDAQRFVLRRLAGVGCCEIRAEIEEIVLYPHQRGVEIDVAGRMLPSQADEGIGFVHCAIGIDAQIALQPARAGDEPGGAVVTRPGIDLVQLHHGRTQSSSAISGTVWNGCPFGICVRSDGRRR